MEISPAYIPLMNVILSVQRVHLTKNNEKRAYRRVITVNEIADYEDYRTTFKWHPAKDQHILDFEKSVMLSSIADRQGVARQDLIDEMARRRDVIHWMRERNIRSYKDVAAIVAEYYARPKQIYEKVLAGEEVKVATSQEA
jgi:flagellar protein FlaI